MQGVGFRLDCDIIGACISGVVGSVVVRSMMSGVVEVEVAPPGVVTASAGESMTCGREVWDDVCGHVVGREVRVSCLALSRSGSSCKREREGEDCAVVGEGQGQ